MFPSGEGFSNNLKIPETVSFLMPILDVLPFKGGSYNSEIKQLTLYKFVDMQLQYQPHSLNFVLTISLTTI